MYASAGANRYSAATGTDTVNSCTDPLTPCATIQHAVDQAESGDEVRVATGTYTGTNSYGGLSQVVYVSKSVAVRGGCTTTNWAPYDPDVNPTVVDAEGDGRVFYITGRAQEGSSSKKLDRAAHEGSITASLVIPSLHTREDTAHIRLSNCTTRPPSLPPRESADYLSVTYLNHSKSAATSKPAPSAPDRSGGAER